MTDDVARLVLRDNYLQGQAISAAEAEGTALLDAQGRMMRDLERAGRLDRRLEFLPDEEALAARRAAGRGLTRPELAVLLAYAKISLHQDLVASDLPDDPQLVHDLELYFPPPLRREFGDEIGRHRLRREIIATHVTNSMVNRVGPTFVTRMTEATGAPPTDVARAYTISRDAFELRRVWSAIEALDGQVPATLQMRMILEAGKLVERTTLWFLRQARHRLDVAARVAEFRPGVAAVLAEVEAILAGPDRDGPRPPAGGVRGAGGAGGAGPLGGERRGAGLGLRGGGDRRAGRAGGRRGGPRLLRPRRPLRPRGAARPGRRRRRATTTVGRPPPPRR